MHRHIITILLVVCLGTSAFAQESTRIHSKKSSSAKLSTDLAVGIPVLQIKGPERDWLVSNQTQYNVSRRLSFVSYTGLLLYASTFHDIKDCIRTDHAFSVVQRFGVGTTVYFKGTESGFFLMGGYKYSSVKSTMSDPELPEITSRYSSLVPDYGLMYNLKVGRKKYFFSGKFYFPLRNLPLGAAESATMELGAGIKLIR
jgi:hypothetical protein